MAVIKVKILNNEEDWQFVFSKRWHLHKGKLCSDCLVMAVF